MLNASSWALMSAGSAPPAAGAVACAWRRACASAPAAGRLRASRACWRRRCARPTNVNPTKLQDDRREACSDGDHRDVGRRQAAAPCRRQSAHAADRSGRRLTARISPPPPVRSRSRATRDRRGHRRRSSTGRARAGSAGRTRTRVRRSSSADEAREAARPAGDEHLGEGQRSGLPLVELERGDELACEHLELAERSSRLRNPLGHAPVGPGRSGEARERTPRPRAATSAGDSSSASSRLRSSASAGSAARPRSGAGLDGAGCPSSNESCSRSSRLLRLHVQVALDRGDELRAAPLDHARELADAPVRDGEDRPLVADVHDDDGGRGRVARRRAPER